jgi:hypothetical protein
MHRIAKQFHKLPPNLREPVKSYLDDRLSDVERVLREEYDYDNMVRIAADMSYRLWEKEQSEDSSNNNDLKVSTRFMEKYVENVRLGRWVSLLPIFEDIWNLFSRVILMDAYLLCRLLYQTFVGSRGHQNNKEEKGAKTRGSNVVVYAGDGHIELLSVFFSKYLKIPLSRVRTGSLTQAVTRCIEDAQIDINRDQDDERLHLRTPLGGARHDEHVDKEDAESRHAKTSAGPSNKRSSSPRRLRRRS